MKVGTVSYMFCEVNTEHFLIEPLCFMYIVFTYSWPLVEEYNPTTQVIITLLVACIAPPEVGSCAIAPVFLCVQWVPVYSTSEWW